MFRASPLGLGGTEETVLIVPIDPVHGFPFDILHRLPGPELLEDLGLEPNDHAFATLKACLWLDMRRLIRLMVEGGRGRRNA